ncbi:glucosyltransferase domain-containing protein [Clostridium aestuarii]|uniref:Glucosyltransferase domain-containing protein n=1 Tax=Clostridium aestuarii TaxID=338193 RepID=A0ABT4CZU8_9CLOT|nr:glucosyltransferase domain-containing protein [Clostridium aestuarii]MCY6484511.1 glucosyltransferase domain-containing protein [Clostridium aestuarii]
MMKFKEFIKEKNVLVEGKQIYIINYLHIFLCYLILNFCIYGPLCRKHYATDSYNMFFTKAKGAFIWNGRVIPYFFSLVYNKFNVNIIEIQSITTSLTIVCLSVIATLLFVIFYNKLKNHSCISFFTIFFACMLATVNFIILEWFLFPEVVLFYTMGMLLAVWAAKVFADRKKTCWNFCVASIYALSSMYMYQININIFMIVVCILIAMNNEFKTNKKSIKETILGILVGFSAAVVSLITNHIIKLIRPNTNFRKSGFSLTSIYPNVIEVIKGQKPIWLNGMNLMKAPWMLYFLVIMLFVIFFAFLQKRRKDKEVSIIFLIFVLGVSFIVIFNPSYFLSTGVWLTPRVIVALPYFLSLLPIIALYSYTGKGVSKYQFIVLSMVILLLIPNIRTTQNIIIDHFATNKIDEEYAYLISKEISAYEKSNNIEIKYIARAKDKKGGWKYNGIDYMAYDVNVRGFYREWSDVNLIKFVSGRDFRIKHMNNEIYNKYFKDKDWNYFNPNEQLVFVGDTLYWCKY